MKKYFHTFILAFLVTSQIFIPFSFSATMGIQIDMLLSQVRTNAGGSLSGGHIYFYAAGTSTPKNVYLDINKGSVAANPYTLDSNGTAYLFGDGLYRIVIKTAAGVTAYDRDNIRYEDFIHGATGSPDNTTFLRGDGTWFKLPRYYDNNAFSDNLTLYGNDLITKGPWVDVRAYGAKCDGVTDDYATIQVALDRVIAGNVGGTIIIPGYCRTTQTLKSNTGGQNGSLTIIGNTKRSGFVWGGETGGTIFESKSAASGNTIAALHIKNLIFNSASTSAKAGKALDLLNIGFNSSIEDCQFEVLTDGIVMGGVYLSKIKNNSFSAIRRDAIQAIGTKPINGNHISGNEFSVYGRYAINVDSINSTEGHSNANVIEGNDFEGMVINWSEDNVTSVAAMRFSDNQNNKWAFNRFEDATGAPAGYRQLIIQGGMQHTLIGNSFGGWGGSFDYAVELTKSSTDVPIGKTVFVGNQWGGAGIAQVKITDTPENKITFIGDIVESTALFNASNPTIGINHVVIYGGGFGTHMQTGAYRILEGSTSYGQYDGMGNLTGYPIVYHDGINFSVANDPPATGTWGAGDIVWNRLGSGGPGLPTDLSSAPVLYRANVAGTPPASWSSLYPIFTTAPPTSATVGRPGMISVDNNYIYWVSPLDNTWRRAAGAGW